ncbi:hypothetical protein GW17_00036018 [Ensete ventricosum]|nr:hypothetical protein GW17_00036018 [Ensete ventricosum]RZS20823.1 hypothetical protein BHM03_00053385 [Ensete ventricosum]
MNRLLYGMQAINEKILSIGFVRVETKSVDAQESLGGGVIVLVTGFLTGEDTVKRDFTQSFFLAPQDKGYYVLNDIFRFVEEADNHPEHQGLVNGTSSPYVPEHGSPTQKEQHALEQTASSAVEDEGVTKVEVDNPSDNGEVVEEEEPMGEVINEATNTCKTVVVESHAVTAQEELPKKSYASIVSVSFEHTS